MPWGEMENSRQAGSLLPICSHKSSLETVERTGHWLCHQVCKAQTDHKASMQGELLSMTPPPLRECLLQGQCGTDWPSSGFYSHRKTASYKTRTIAQANHETSDKLQDYPDCPKPRLQWINAHRSSTPLGKSTCWETGWGEIKLLTTPFSAFL